MKIELYIDKQAVSMLGQVPDQSGVYPLTWHEDLVVDSSKIAKRDYSSEARWKLDLQLIGRQTRRDTPKSWERVERQLSDTWGREPKMLYGMNVVDAISIYDAKRMLEDTLRKNCPTSVWLDNSGSGWLDTMYQDRKLKIALDFPIDRYIQGVRYECYPDYPKLSGKTEKNQDDYSWVETLSLSDLEVLMSISPGIKGRLKARIASHKALLLEKYRQDRGISDLDGNR